MTKDDLESGAHLPCKAFLKWPEDLKQVCNGTSRVAILDERRNLESPHNYPREPVFRQRRKKERLPFRGTPVTGLTSEESPKKRLKKLAQRAVGTCAVQERAAARVCPQRPLVDSSSKVWRDLRKTRRG